jgi:putative FmdB family regulatory protein
MPTYEFECLDHGAFDEQRPMALAKSPAPCPSCGREAPRVLSLTNIPYLAASARRARDINERSCHEPRLVRRETPKPQEPPTPQLQASHGRPWAVGH